MAVQSDTSRIQYAGNNSTTTSYAVPFVFQENSHLKAIARTSAGVESVVTLTNHTGAGNVNGGTVRTAVAVPATSTLTIYREVPATQTTTYAEGGDFPAASHERALDKLTFIAQQLDRKVGSAIRLSAATQLPDLNPPLTNQQHILSSVGGAAPSWQALPSLSIGPVIATGSTAARSVQDRFANAAFVEDFGAVGDGVTDDSAAFQAALDTKLTIHLDGSKQYVVKNINLSNSRTIIGNGARIKAASGASYIFKLTDFSPHIQDIYISECSASLAAIVFGGSRYASIHNVRILNCSAGAILFQTNVLTTDTIPYVAKPQLSNVHIEWFETVGLDVRSNVLEINAVNVYIDSGAVGNPQDRPKPNAYGVKVVSTGSTAAFGGHMYVNVTTINSQWGWHFTDAELTKLNSCIADGHSSDGISLNGHCQYFDIADTLIGTCGRSINVSGTSLNISLSGIRSIFAGLIPPWGAPTFFTYSAPFYDLAVNDTATVSVDTESWFGGIKTLSANNNSINWVGGDKFDLITTSTVASGSTVYLGPAGHSANINNALWVPATACRIVGFYVATNVVPSAGESFTYTINVNTNDTAMTASSSGNSSFVAQTFTAPTIAVSKNDIITLKLVTSSGAAAANHRGYIVTVPVV